MGWLRDRREERAASRARQRASTVPTEDLRAWVDTSLIEVGRAARQGAYAAAVESAEAMLSILEELDSRTR